MNTIDERISERLKLSVAVQLIAGFINTEHARYSIDPTQFSESERENLTRAIQFYENTTGKKLQKPIL